MFGMKMVRVKVQKDDEGKTMFGMKMVRVKVQNEDD